MTLTLAEIDVDEEGNIAVEDLAQAQRMVDSMRDELLNAGVVAALILSIMFGLAYEENEALLRLQADLQSGERWDYSDVSDLTSFVANMTAVCSAIVTVYLSSTMYTQLSFWMPTLEAQLWYVSMSTTAARCCTLSKDLTVYSSLVTLGLEIAVTGGPLDVLAFVPLGVLAAVAIAVNTTLKPACRNYLNDRLLHHVGAAPQA